MNKKRVILLMQVSSYRNQSFMAAAKRLNIEIVHGIDIDQKLADHWHVPLALQFNQPEKAVQYLVEFAQKNPIQAILAVDDSAAVLAALASKHLGLPHNDSQAAQAARNKYQMRQKLKTARVPSPQFHLYSLEDDPVQIGKEIDYPCVVKPLMLSGSRGVIRADHPTEFEQVFKRVNRISPQNEVLVEDFISGFEVAVEGLLDGGRFHTLALFDKPDPLDGPFFEETIYVTPSRLPDSVQDEIAHCTAQAAQALGLHHGPVHAELRVNEAGPWIVEVAGRSIGGLCAKTLRFGPDISLEELILRQAVGMDLELDLLKRETAARGVMMIPIPEAGLLKDVNGIEEAQQVAGIEEITITAKLNYPLIPLPEGESYLGFIFARGEQPDEVEAALRQAHQRLQFKIEPLLTIL